MLAGKEQHMLLVTSVTGKLEGVLTHVDVLSALNVRSGKGSIAKSHSQHQDSVAT
jgi:CBS-domain-containing membrane protein